MKVLYDTILKAKYTGRPNRFVVTLDLMVKVCSLICQILVVCGSSYLRV